MRRLFLCPWASLNDAHEAQLFIRGEGLNYAVNPERAMQLQSAGWVPEDVVDKTAADARVCSLSRTWSSNLLWSHYADAHRGIAIGVEIGELPPSVQSIEVSYDDVVPIVDPPVSQKTAIEGLQHKASEWHYEKETRLVTFDKESTFGEHVKVTDVIFGLRTTEADVCLVQRLTGSGARFWRVCRRPGSYGLDACDIVSSPT